MRSAPDGRRRRAAPAMSRSGSASCWMMLAAGAMWTAPSLLTGIYLDLDDAGERGGRAHGGAAVRRSPRSSRSSTASRSRPRARLRGLKDTKVPMIICGLGYWVFGLGSGVPLAFAFDLGGTGLWWGLAIGLARLGHACCSCAGASMSAPLSPIATDCHGQGARRQAAGRSRPGRNPRQGPGADPGRQGVQRRPRIAKAGDLMAERCAAGGARARIIPGSRAAG